MGFGSFESICTKAPFPICLVVGKGEVLQLGILPNCYARPVEIANTMIFQVGTAFAHIGTLVVLLMIIFNIRSKYTAIGRTEMLYFFYLCMGLVILSLVVDCGVSPPSSTSYPYFVAIQLGFALACCITLMCNGILFFQFWEDGSRLSMIILRLISFVWFAVNFIISLFTFKSWGIFDAYGQTTTLFVLLYIINAVILFVFVISSIVLVLFALDSYWPLGNIVLGVFFFVAGQVLLYAFSNTICTHLKHYIDGIFFGTLCNGFTIMMIYKFWDSITTDDLEFLVANIDYGVGLIDDDEKRNSTFFQQ